MVLSTEAIAKLIPEGWVQSHIVTGFVRILEVKVFEKLSGTGVIQGAPLSKSENVCVILDDQAIAAHILVTAERHIGSAFGAPPAAVLPAVETGPANVESSFAPLNAIVVRIKRVARLLAIVSHVFQHLSLGAGRAYEAARGKHVPRCPTRPLLSALPWL